MNGEKKIFWYGYKVKLKNVDFLFGIYGKFFVIFFYLGWKWVVISVVCKV